MLGSAHSDTAECANCHSCEQLLRAEGAKSEISVTNTGMRLINTLNFRFFHQVGWERKQRAVCFICGLAKEDFETHNGVRNVALSTLVLS